MNCELTPCEGGYCCEACGAGPYPDPAASRNCGKAAPTESPKCECGQPLKRRQKMPEKLWWWWCKGEDRFVRECKQCNAAIASPDQED